MLISFPMNEVIRTDLQIYSDASEQVVAAVAYLKVSRTENEYEFGFVFDKSKLSHRDGHTLPRLELCSVVLASESAMLHTSTLTASLS